MIIIIISFLFFYYRFYKNQIRLINEKITLETQYKQTLLQTQLEIQEQTLKNISQEIHDNIGQSLSLAKLTLNTILPDAEEDLRQKIINSKDLVSKAIADLRDLSRSLDTDYVQEMGLQRSIEYELELMQKTGMIRTKLQVAGSIVRLNKQKELILFRIIQETFNNIIKHAEASELIVDIQYLNNQLLIVISDNGKGMDLSPLEEGDNTNFGLGIRNMHNRAKLIGADFSMSSILGKRTDVKISLPTETNNHADKS